MADPHAMETGYWFAAMAIFVLLTSTARAQSAASVAAAEERDEEPNQQNQVEGIEVEGEGLTTFWQGTSLVVKPRAYYMNRDRDKEQDNVAFAFGGAVEYKSGWALDRLQIGATLFTSQRIYGPPDKDGTRLLKPGQQSFSVLGEAHATLNMGDGHAMRFGRQSFDLPWLGRHDIRMAPNTFEAIAMGRQVKIGFAYIAGYVDGIKRIDDDEFIAMSQAAGAADSNEGLGLLGAQYSFADGSLIGATYQASFEVMNTLFVKAEKSFELSSGVSLRTFAQYTDQRSTGNELIGNFATHLSAVKAELFLPNLSFRLAASQAGDGKALQSPYGSEPNYLGMIYSTYGRAGEEAWLVGMSYDLMDLGASGLSVFSNFSMGKTPDSGPNASPDENEYDITVDYRFPTQSALRGLWVRLRSAWIDGDENDNGADFLDFRLIVNYSFDPM